MCGMVVLDRKNMLQRLFGSRDSMIVNTPGQAWKTNVKPNLRYVQGQAGINGLNHAMATVRQRWGIRRTLDKARRMAYG